MAEDAREIRRLIALYSQLLDDQRWDDVAGLFAQDGQLPWAGRTLIGPSEIAEGLPATQPPTAGGIKHFVYSPVIEIQGDSASAWSDVIVALVKPDHSAEMSFVGRYHDRFRLEDGHWRYVSHVTVATGEDVPEGEQQPPAR